MGLATCWIGSGFDDEALQKEYVNRDVLRPKALIAFGEPERGKKR